MSGFNADKFSSDLMTLCINHGAFGLCTPTESCDMTAALLSQAAYIFGKECPLVGEKVQEALWDKMRDKLMSAYAECCREMRDKYR